MFFFLFLYYFVSDLHLLCLSCNRGYGFSTLLSRVSFADTEQYWLFRTWDLKLPPGLTLLTFMATRIFHVSFASACGHGKDQTTSTGTVISSFICFLQVLDSRRTSSRNMCC